MRSTSFLAAFAGFLALGSCINHVGLDLFHGDNCEDYWYSITVDVDSCYTTDMGFSSYRINADGSGGGTVTAYTRNDCGCPSCGSHGYGDQKGSGDGCGKNFGFVANAIGYINAESLLLFGDLAYETISGVGGLKPPKRDENGTVIVDLDDEPASKAGAVAVPFSA